MRAMWCCLPVFLAIVSSMAVMGESTSAKPDTTEPTSVRTTADILGRSTRKALETSSSTKPTSVVTSVSAVQSTRATLQTTDSTEQTAVVTNAKVLEQSTSETLESSHPTEPTSAGVTQNPSSTTSLPTASTLYPTSARIEGTSGSPVQLTSTTDPPTTRTSSYSTEEYLIQTTQGVSSSQQSTAHVMQSSTFPGLKETSASQEPTVANRSEEWTTADPASVSEVTSFSTPVTNISEVDGILGSDVKGKTQSPPTSMITSTTKFSTTAAATPSEASGSKVTSAIPVVNDITKVTTKNYNRLTTAQAATKRISLVTQCLIVIAILAGICTIFVICTIVLCTKLSTQRHNYRVNQMNGTELICISALLPEEERKMRKKLRPKRLRDLKEMTTGQASDTDDDDLTLQSFVTEH